MTPKQKVWVVAQAIGNVMQCQSDEQCSAKWSWRKCSHCKGQFREAAQAAMDAARRLRPHRHTGERK